MTYINFRSGPNLFVNSRLISGYLTWLDENVGEPGSTWDFKTGLAADGIYIEDEAMAIVFKLRFGL